MNENKASDIKKSKPRNLPAILGWAAAIFFMGGILWMLKQNNDLNKALQTATVQNTVLKTKNSETENQLKQSNKVLKILSAKDVQTYTLAGNQAVAPTAFAKVYLNQKEGNAYVDIKNLPTPPNEKAYQVWTLKMEPFSATSIGLINLQNNVADGIYKFSDFSLSEAIGITLEQEGGSETPNLSQLYTLGTIAK